MPSVDMDFITIQQLLLSSPGTAICLVAYIYPYLHIGIMPSKRFEYLPHTADAAFAAYGKSFEAALESAALALLNVMLDVKKIKGLRSRQVKVKIEDSASSRETIVWYILQDMLSRIDAEKLNAYDFKIREFREANGRVKVKGILYCKEHTGDFALLSVKAVTPHDLAVRRSDKGYSISVVIDV